MEKELKCNFPVSVYQGILFFLGMSCFLKKINQDVKPNNKIL